MNNVFILGAGASKDAGAPLMADFLEQAARLHRSGHPDIAGYREDFERIEDLRHELSNILNKARLPLDNIEALFSLVEMGKIIGRLGNATQPDEIERIRSSLIAVIVRTLEITTALEIRQGFIEPPRYYNNFAKMILNFMKKPKGLEPSKYAVITFNYDVALEIALEINSFPPQYGLDDDSINRGIPVLKLHGSLNWARCPQCSGIFHLPLTLLKPQPHQTKYVNHIGTEIRNGSYSCPKDSTPLGGPVIVPPSWDKAPDNLSLSSVWRKAASVLAQADNIYIIGYSLPETDMFFRYLFSLGTFNSRMLNRLWIINPDGEVKDRYKTFISSGIQERVEYRTELFGPAIGSIGESIESDYLH